MKPWTAQDEELLRKLYGTRPCQQIADQFGRSLLSIKARAARLGLATRVRWTDKEDQLLRDHYRTRGSSWCASQLRRRRGTVYQRAAKLGLTKRIRALSDEQLIAAIREHHPAGWSDAEIARWAAEQFEAMVDRHRVGELRQRLGLPHNALSAHRRQCVAARTRQQLADGGLQSLAGIRVARWNQWKRDLGWPEHLTVRAVQSLEMFWRHGQLTRIQLCDLLGVSSAKRTAPCSNTPGGTVLAELQRAGLISRLPKAIKVPGDLVLHQERPRNPTRACKTKYIDLYFLNPGVEPNGKTRKHTAAG